MNELEKIVNEIKADIKRQKEIYNNENSTIEQQQRAYKRKQELQEELRQYQTK